MFHIHIVLQATLAADVPPSNNRAPLFSDAFDGEGNRNSKAGLCLPHFLFSQYASFLNRFWIGYWPHLLEQTGSARQVTL